MARPSFDPRDWMNATTPPVAATIPTQLEADGYAVRDPLTSAQLNRHLYELWEYTGWLDAEAGQPFAVEHYTANTTDATGAAIAAGEHSAINCDSLDVRATSSGANGGGTISFPQAAFSSDNTAVVSLGTIGDGDCRLRIEHGGNSAAELELGGGLIEATLAASATWAMQVDNASDKTLYIRNAGAGNADLDVDGDTNLQGALDVAGLTSADAGVSVSAVATENSFVRYDAVQTFELDVSPYGGGWVNQENNGGGTVGILRHYTGTPPYVAPTSTLYCCLWRPLVLPVNATTTLNASAKRVITKVKLRYYRAAAGDQITFELISVARSGSGAETTVFSYDHTSNMTTTAALTLFDSGAISHTLSPETNFYFLRIILTPNSGGNMRVADVTLEYTERHLQAPGM